VTEILATDWFVWGVGLILVFQLLVILLGEAIYRADRRTLPIGGIFRALRNIVLPLGVLFVFLTRLLEIDRDSVLVRLVETALWTSVVYVVLLIFNIVVFHNAAQNSWRSRAPKLFQDLIRLMLVVIGAAIVLSVVWRQDLGGLIAALGVGSIVLGLALQETLGNLMSGIALFFERPFSVGDWISVGGKSGQVVQITWRSVHMRTAANNLLVLPNSALGRETITNYSQPTDQQVLVLSFSFGLDAPPNKVKDVLIGVASEIPLVMTEPAPRAAACEVLGDRIRYEARVRVEHGRDLPQVTDQFTSAVWYAARRAGLPLPLPQSVEVQVRDVQADPVEGRSRIESQLRGAEGLRALPPDAIAQLAESTDTVSFGVGEELIAAGVVPEYVYVIAAGVAIGTYGEGNGERGTIRLGAGEVLGVTSLARAQASDVRVVAESDVDTLRIRGDAVAQALKQNPTLSNQFARIGQARTDALRRSSQQAANDVGAEVTEDSRQSSQD
jgi:small-conductance mechanosensitive channel